MRARRIGRRAVLGWAGGLGAGLLATGGPAPARAATATTAAPPLAGQRRTLPGGRTYWLSGAGPRLVVGLHGSNLSAANVNAGMWVTGNPATTGWQRHAALRGYTLALAEGLPGMVSWNVGGGWPSGRQDDVGYLLDLVADVRTTRPVGEVYACGFSAGAALAWRLAAEHPETVLACASYSGWAPAYPDHPIDAWHVHGTGDTTVPIRGGFVGVFRFTFPPAADEALRCRRGSRVVLYPTPGGHGTPGWAADLAWQFFTAGRLGR